METAKRFTNFSDETFIGVWDKQEYKIEAGETMMLQSYLAEHFAKHLIDKELTKEGIPTNRQDERKRLMNLCLGGESLKAESKEELETKMLNVDEVKDVDEKETVKEDKKFCDQCDSKGVRHKKDCPSLTPKEENKDENKEEEFEGLK